MFCSSPTFVYNPLLFGFAGFSSTYERICPTSTSSVLLFTNGSLLPYPSFPSLLCIFPFSAIGQRSIRVSTAICITAIYGMASDGAFAFLATSTVGVLVGGYQGGSFRTALNRFQVLTTALKG
jgi:hypothetical protein